MRRDRLFRALMQAGANAFLLALLFLLSFRDECSCIATLGGRSRRLYGGGRAIAVDAALPLTTVSLGLTPPGR